MICMLRLSLKIHYVSSSTMSLDVLTTLQGWIGDGTLWEERIVLGGKERCLGGSGIE
jgi:hypothetical protein